jgi:hypothetical protein
MGIVESAVQSRLDYPLSQHVTIGNLIERRGISIRYIFSLCGRYEQDKILNYINALVDRAGQSKDECDDNNSHAVH